MDQESSALKLNLLDHKYTIQFYTNLINRNINLNGYHLTNTKLKWEKLKSRLFLIRDIGLNMKQWRRKSTFLNKLQNMSK